jgi:hypothetical protein
MQKNDELRTDAFVTAVYVSVKLGKVLVEAKNISLEAMNAKALVARAGENVRTFKPITDYMVELSNDTIHLVDKINTESEQISKSTLTTMRSIYAVAQFIKAKAKSENALYGDSFDKPMIRAQKELQQFQKDLERHLRRLHELLEEIEMRMLAANVVTSTSRLEAATVSDLYQANFEAIVTKFELAAKNIRSIVIECRKILKLNRYLLF